MWLRPKLTGSFCITTHCNAGCPQCQRTDPNGIKKSGWLPLISWTVEDFQKAVPRPELYEHIIFCGTWGDPLMNKDLAKIVSYITQNSDAKIDIDTNGSIRDEDWYWEIGVAGGHNLTMQFAVDGSTQEMHETYRQNTSLEKTLNNMKTLSMTNAFSLVHTVVFKHNQDYIQDIAELVKKYGAKQMTCTVSDRFDETDVFKFTKGNKEYQLERVTDDKMRMEGRWKVFD